MHLLARALLTTTALLAGTGTAQAQEPDARFRGAPRIGSEDGWSVKPRGRLQIDVGEVAVGDTPLLGELRRAQFGFEGTAPGDLSYIIEAQFAEGIAEITEAAITWEVSDDISVTAGQHNNFQSLEELSSDLFTSFLERAAFTDAFSFERRVGVSSTVTRGNLLVQFGLFGENLLEIDSADDQMSLDARVVYAPELAGMRLHLGGSAHWRDNGDAPQRGVTVRYRGRPLLHADDRRFVSTAPRLLDGERRFGLEAALIRGPFHAVAELHWLRTEAILPDADESYFGGYAEIGWFFTGETRGYRGGRWNRTRVLRPIETGGAGALQANVRFDRVDLDEGGRQDALVAALVWLPDDHLRVIVNYARLWFEDAAIPGPAGRRDYGADLISARLQFDF